MTAADDQSNLPQGWIWTSLSEVTVPVPNVRPEQKPECEFVYADISSVSNELFRISDPKRFLGADAPSRARRPVRPFDTLFSNVRTYLRNIAIVQETDEVNICSTGFTVLRPRDAVDPQFLFRYTLTDKFINIVTPEQTGTHYPATSDRVVLSQPLPLPPLAEQRRIVAKVEALLARVQAARERLARVPRVLKRFRQAVLTGACNGQLTAGWRESDQSSDLPANNFESTDLPARWRAETVANVCVRIVDCPHSTPKWTDAGEICLRTTNFLAGNLDLSQVRYVSTETFQNRISRLLPHVGDVLYSREGGILGIACLFPAGLRACLGQRMMLMRPEQSRCVPAYLMHVLNAPVTTTVVREMTGGTASPHLNVGDIKAFAVPLPPLAEQHEIVRRVDALFKLADKIERRVTDAAKRADKLTQAILAKAFRGELVPTEAELARAEGREFESAAELLARVGASAAPATTRKRGSNRRTTANQI